MLCARLLRSRYFYLAKLRVPVPSRCLQPCFLCLWSRLPWGPSLSGLKHHFFFPVCLMSLSIKPSGFMHTVACIRTAFLSGLTTFNVWMDHGLFVRSVKGHMEYLHSSLTSFNICGITSESPMIQTSFTVNCFISFHVLKSIKARKKGRTYVSFTCV